MTSVVTLVTMLRAVHVAATLSLLGTAGFIAWILPAASMVPDPLRRRLTRLGWISGSIALLAGIAWFMLEAGVIADADTPTALLAALPLVAAHTRFGTVLVIRLAVLLTATVLARTPRGGPLYGTLVLSGAALCLQGLIGHAGATAGTMGDGLVLSEALHLLAAGLWLGGLLPLWLSLRALASEPAAAVCERFSPLGLGCVLVIGGTAWVQGVQLIGGWPGLFGTTYGRIALLKITLFLVALVLAALNRLRLTDRLATGTAQARRHLLASVASETGIGLAIVIAAAFMASTMPAVDAARVGPFSARSSPATLTDSPTLRRDRVALRSRLQASGCPSPKRGWPKSGRERPGWRHPRQPAPTTLRRFA